MSDPNRADNWRLEEGEDTTGRWKLEEAEQNRISQWALQEDTAYEPAHEEAGWHPVEYARDPYQQEGGGGWVLPSLVGLALIAVVAYGVWIGITQLDTGRIGTFLSNPLASSTEPTEEVAAVVPAEEATATPETAPVEAAPPTPTVAPTDTTVPPTPTTAPVPAMVEETYVTITEQFGVNARLQPTTDGEVLRIVEQGEEFLVLDEQDGWLQIMASPEQPAWISADAQFVSQRTEQLALDAANQARAQLGVEPLEGAVAAVGDDEMTADEPEEVALAPTSTSVDASVAVTTSTPFTGGLAPIQDEDAVDPGQTGTGGEQITGAVNIIGGLNARSQPDLNGELIALLEDGTPLTFTGRTADNDWLRATLDNGTTIWVSAQYLTLDGDVATLPVVDGVAVEDPAQEPTTAPVDETATGDSAEEDTSTVDEVSETTASVNSLLGAAIRNAPEASAEAIDNAIFENVLTVTGRSADDAWLQVDLGADGSGWVLASAVDLSVPLASLPVITP